MERSRTQFSLPWLVRLRWGLLAAEAVALPLVAKWLAIDAALGGLFALLAAAALANAALERMVERDADRGPVLFAAALALDVGVLTAILHATGGAANPFSVLYLVYITLAAILLGAPPTWGLTLLSIGAYGSLFWFAPADAHSGHDPHAFAGHLRAMWIAFSLTAALTAGSVVRLTSAIQARDRELEAMRERAMRSDRLAALATLAAGAAHELGTPLGTIAVAAGELDRNLAGLPGDQRERLLDDVRLIGSELARCRRILEQMSAAGGEFAGETPVTLSLAALVEEARSQLAGSETPRLRVHVDAPETTLVPHRAFVRVLLCLLRNAFDASRSDGEVELGVRVVDGGTLEVAVVDRGEGMTAAVLERATEPFFTTKPAGKGMGMGLFLASALAEQFGGTLVLTSSPAGGTTAALRLPPVLLPASRGAGHE